ncbi:conserved hypothetical protein [Alteromonas macleodii]
MVSVIILKIQSKASLISEASEASSLETKVDPKRFKTSDREV